MTSEKIDPLEICALDPDQLAERLRWIRSEITSHALGRERLADGLAIEISDAPGIRDQIDHWIELEGECCGGIRFERHPSRTSGQVRVEIHGVDPDGRLFGAIPELRGRGPSASRIGRILQAGGLGAIVSVFLFCVLPIGIAALLGATAVTGAVQALDDPLWIGPGALAAAGFVWWRLGRRSRANC